MARPKTLAAVLALASIALSACASGGQDDDGAVASRMDAYLAASHRLERFSGSTLVARGGRIILRQGYGMANYELGVPNTPETKFRLGSITKQFTAMAILQLEAQGRLQVGDPVETVFPGFPNGDRITISHLLTHTSGLPNMTEFPDYAKTMALPSTALETVGRFKDRPLDFEPGERFSYSNSGYVLLGAVIEKVTGLSYEEYVCENIFRPIGMDDTGYDHVGEVLKNRASGYEFSDDRLANAPYIDMSIPHAAGALYSTVDDLFKWDRALSTDKLIPAAARARMFEPFKEGYAFGWSVGSFAGRRNIRHGGGINGFTTDISRFPDDDACVIVLSNFSTGFIPEISDALAGYLFGQAVETPKAKTIVKLPAAVLDAYQGQYKPEGIPVVFTITRDGDSLFVQVPQQPRAVLLAESETEFFMKNVSFDLTFHKDASGRVTHFVLVQGKRETQALKVE